MSLVDGVEMIDKSGVECLDVGQLLLPVLLEEEEENSNDELLSFLVLVLALLGD